MLIRRAFGALFVACVLVPALPASAEETDQQPVVASDGRDDVVVVAVIDNAFTPYHLDFLASGMPQHKDSDPSNDLPLDQSPDTWLPGFPAPSANFSVNRLDLTLPTNPGATSASLDAADSAKWNAVQSSTPTATSLYWIPGSKVIGAVTFSSGKIHGAQNAHGVGSTSVSTGNIYGSCPECLLVFIQYGDEQALDWAMSQPWIDVITNSYGFSAAYRDRYYDGGNTPQQKAAIERGQSIFFSAGNGQDGNFVVPNSTLHSSQEGPDWIVTVGATTPAGGDYSGAGKPADVAAPGGSYPAAYGGTLVSDGRTFSGTSNATPVVAGMYGKSLYEARRALAGPSRTQAGGVIATGTPVVCGALRPDCELGDGQLTIAELRTRLFHGAIHTPQGPSPAGVVSLPEPTADEKFFHEGHGTYKGKLGDFAAELARIFDPMVGAAAPLTRPAGESDWMIVDSWCRQQIWGAWGGGYYTGQALPADNGAYPIRNAYVDVCPHLVSTKP